MTPLSKRFCTFETQFKNTINNKMKKIHLEDCA